MKFDKVVGTRSIASLQIISKEGDPLNLAVLEKLVG